MKLNNRLTTYNNISTQLALLSNPKLSKLLDKSTFKSSIGGATTTLSLDGSSNIFVKKIRLSDLEMLPENIMSTVNFFDLPMHYQYGIGSAGFGAWRELAIHTMTTNWVLTNQCPNFPLMYHWRLLPKPTTSPKIEQLNEIESDVQYWENSPAVRSRLKGILHSSTEIVLFLESLPENLDQWFRKQLVQGGVIAKSACHMIETNLNAITSFINAQGLLHFDAHFWNILTDGNRLYFSDFGLALSKQFELSEGEKQFFIKHQHYDKASTMRFYVQWILIELIGEAQYEALCCEYASGNRNHELPSAIESIIARYAPMAVVMNQFYQSLKQKKSTPYPAHDIERICSLLWEQ